MMSSKFIYSFELRLKF